MINGNVLFVAVHLGPYQSIRPMETVLRKENTFFLLEGVSQEARQTENQTYWNLGKVLQLSGSLEQFLLDYEVIAIILGTSDGLPQGNIEEGVGRAGKIVGVPVFVIEDFPGNYRYDPGGRLDGLFVEDEGLNYLNQSYAIAPGLIHNTGNPRYDVLRSFNREQLGVNARVRLGIDQRKVALWAGQPDDENSYRTLERLIPYFMKEDFVLLFKAHPRDALYQDHAYDRLLSRVSCVKDVTAEQETISLCCAADLVMTQFSSVGVEASYLGISTLFVLFDDLGKAYLKHKKGYPVVPWAERKCAFLLESGSPIRETLEMALLDTAERKKVKTNFEKFYGARPQSTQAIATVIGQCLTSNI